MTYKGSFHRLGATPIFWVTGDLQDGQSVRIEKHFEVKCKGEAGWTVTDTAADEQQALALAQQRLKQSGFAAVHVSQEVYNPHTGVFKSRTVFEEEAKSRPKPSSTDVVAPCKAVQDLERWEVCKAANVALEDQLHQWGMIASECFFDYLSYKKLADQGSALAGAVEAAICYMLPGEDDLGPARTKAVMPVLKEAACRLQKAHESGAIPVIRKNDFFSLAIAYENDEDRCFKLSLAVMRLFRGFQGIEQRLAWLLQNLNPLPTQWSLALVDRWIAECLMHTAVMNGFLADQSTNGARVATLFRLAEGKLDGKFFARSKLEGPHAKLLKALHGHLGEGRLTLARDALVGHAAYLLNEREPLTDGEFLNELGANADLYYTCVVDQQTRTPYGRIGDIMVTRASRLIHMDALEKLTEGQLDPYKGLVASLELEPIALGETCKDRLGDFMMTIMTPPKRADALKAGAGNPLTRMQELSRLQAKLIKSGLSEAHKSRMTRILDQHCTQLLADTGLFKRMQQSKDSGLEKLKKLATMMAEHYFTDGVAMDAARRHAWNFLSSRDVIRYLITPPKTPDEVQALMTLQTLMQKAGLEESEAAGEEDKPVAKDAVAA